METKIFGCTTSRGSGNDSDDYVNNCKDSDIRWVYTLMGSYHHSKSVSLIYRISILQIALFC